MLDTTSPLKDQNVEQDGLNKDRRPAKAQDTPHRHTTSLSGEDGAEIGGLCKGRGEAKCCDS